MTPFDAFVRLCRQLETTSGRLDKIELVSDFLRGVDPEEVGIAVAFLTGRPFPTSDPRVLGVRGLPRTEPAARPSLSLSDVADQLGSVADAAGPGSRRMREDRLAGLAGRATASEQEFLSRIVTGEMRTGVSDGLVLEAIASAAGAELGAVRRAALFLGDLSTVAALARSAGAEALASTAPRLFVPMLPMLAEIATDFGEILAAHRGRTGLEFKYDGARIQLHADGDRVEVWTRRLSNVTPSLPDVVAIARRDLRGMPFILDGEVVGLDAAGRPLPFQELMRRFRRVHGVDAVVKEIPLALFFFDCLVAEGRSLIDEPQEVRWRALEAVTGGRYLAEREIAESVEAGSAFHARALSAGHEGVMAKDLRSAYQPGGRGKRWFKLKQPQTLDCVIVAVDRGSGRRRGWLSNYHLAVRAGESFADVGKTFKGFTDRQFKEMTERLWSLAVEDDGYTLRVRPEIVVEVAYNDIQRSPTYPSGYALRFARITRVRDDKAPGQASTLQELDEIYERQFATKGRVPGLPSARAGSRGSGSPP
jgi:DNA ligase-1